MLSFSKIAQKCIRATADSFLAISSKPMEQQFRTTFVLERRKPFPLYKKGGRPGKMKHRHFIYDLVKHVDSEKHPLLKVILTTNVDGIGETGDLVELKQLIAYNSLILKKRAVYASPENLKKYTSNKGDQRTYSSLKAPLLVKLLQSMRVCVAMNAETPWTIEKSHILVSLRKANLGVLIDAIELPEKSITGPDLDEEGNEFYVTVTINNREKAYVRCVLRHLCTDPNKKLPFPEDYWKYPGDPIHEEFEEVLKSLPKPVNERDVPRPDLEADL